MLSCAFGSASARITELLIAFAMVLTSRPLPQAGRAESSLKMRRSSEMAIWFISSILIVFSLSLRRSRFQESLGFKLVKMISSENLLDKPGLTAKRLFMLSL